MKELESLLKKKAKAGLIQNVVDAESGIDRFPASEDDDNPYRLEGEGRTTVIKHPVTNVEQHREKNSKTIKATTDMMPKEREDYEDEQTAQSIYEAIIRKAKKK